MSFLQNLFGNATEVAPEKVQAELHSILLDGEEVQRVFKLHRDLVVMTNYRIITVDKQGITGKKQSLVSIPYRAIKRFARENAGMMDSDCEIYIWLTGEAAPIKWELHKGINVDSVYQLLSYYVLTAR